MVLDLELVDVVLGAVLEVKVVDELMNRTNLLNSAFSLFLLLLEESVVPEVGLEVDEVADEIAVLVDDVADEVVGLEDDDVADEVVGLEDSQITDVHSFRLLDLLVFTPKSANVFETSRP